MGSATDRLVYATLLLASAGCRQLLGIDEPAIVTDGGPDAPGDGAVADAVPDGAPSMVTLTFREGENGYDGVVDTYLDGGTPNQGRGDNNEVRWAIDQQRYALIRFDDLFGDDASRIPADATIVSATLAVFVSKECSAAGQLHIATSPWFETTTFNTFGPVPGVDDADRGPLAAAAPFENGPATIDVTTSVTAWANRTLPNLGWILTGAVGAGECAARSSQDGIVANRPALTVTFR